MKFKSLKARVVAWFGSIAFVVLTLFALFFNYFLNSSIDNNIKLKLQLVANAYTQLLRKIIKEKGASMIVVTHDNRIYKYADRIVHMEDGKIIKVAS